MVIRGLEVADMANIRLRAEQIAAAYYPELIPDLGLEHALLTELRSNTHHYAKVVGNAGEPKAALLAKVGGNLWATRKHATVLLWYSDSPGAGLVLLRDFRRWVDEQKGVVLAGLIDDFGMDARLVATLRREGFSQRGGAYVHFPRGEKK
jgi:hypothetical protein